MRPRALNCARDTGALRLEPRTLLSGSYPYELVLPEGFASDAIRQIVPLENSGTLPADYRLIARYERAFAEQILASGTLAPDTRGTISVSDPANPSATVVRKGEPYALVLESTQPMAASLEHSDFGSVVSVPFTDLQSTVWTFAEVRRQAGVAHDFLLVYNPGSTTITATLRLYDNSGVALSVTQTIEGQKRGGWAIDDLPGLADGVYGAQISAGSGIVASQSSYGLTSKKSFGVLGSSNAGATSGVLPLTDLATRTRDADGQGVPIAPSRNATISILNSSSGPASVTLSFVADDDTLPAETRSVIVPARTRVAVDVQSLALSDDFEFALGFASSAPVALQVSTADGVAGGGILAAGTAAAAWDFAGGFMDATRAGDGLFESLSIYNPQSVGLQINIDFLLDSGQVFSVSLQLDARRAASVPIHLISDFVSRAAQQSYSIHVSASQPLVAAYRRWDAIDGGFVTMGTPGDNAISLQGMTP